MDAHDQFWQEAEKKLGGKATELAQLLQDRLSSERIIVFAISGTAKEQIKCILVTRSRLVYCHIKENEFSYHAHFIQDIESVLEQVNQHNLQFKIFFSGGNHIGGSVPLSRHVGYPEFMSTLLMIVSSMKKTIPSAQKPSPTISGFEAVDIEINT